MRVAIMGRSVRPGATGVGRFAANIIRALAESMPQGSLTVFLTQDAHSQWNGNVREVRAPWPTPNEYARAIWEQLVVPTQVEQLGIDLYHSPNYILPLRRLACPSLVTVHDLSFRRLELHKLRSHLYLSLMTSAAVRKARAVIADSEYTKQGILQHYPYTQGRVEVIYGGLAPGLSRPSEATLQRFRQRIKLDRPVILYVGTQEPRKNLVRLVQAFDRVVDRRRLPHILVLLGPPGWKMSGLERAIEASPYRDRILRPGYAYDDELSCWYAIADLLAYPSLEEGFGLPVLEAMALGTPVVTSDVTCLPELTGQAALTIDPFDVESLAEALERVLTDPSLSASLRAAGLERAKRFTWEKAAQLHYRLFQQVLGKG